MSGEDTAARGASDDLAIWTDVARARAGLAPRLDHLPDEVAEAARHAMALGAPVDRILTTAMSAAEARRATRDRVAVAVAPAASVLRTMAALPVLGGLGMALLLDIDVIGYHATPVGMVTGGLAVGLVVAALLWAAALRGAVLRAARVDPIEARAIDAVSSGLRAGLPAPAALRAAGPVLAPGPEVVGVVADLQRGALALELGRAPGGLANPQIAAAAHLMRAAGRDGFGAADALGHVAARVRADHAAAVQADAERLAVRLTLPTVLCLLPATLLLVGAPLLHGLLQGVATP